MKYGYSVQPVHFLLKPISKTELAEALAADLRMKKRSERAVLKSGSKLVTLPIETFIYAESYDHNVLVHTADGVKIFRTSLTDMKCRTEGCHVCRCHNSYIVNMRFISEITKHSIILKTGVRLPVCRKYGSLLQASFTRYINGVK